MHVGKSSNSEDKKYPPGSFMGRLRERKIIATLAAFAGSGVVIIELAHHILVNHYHFPHQIVDFCIVTIAGALIGTLTWRWFRGAEKRPGNVKVEVLVVPLVILLIVVIDLKLIFVMTGISINMLLVGIVALCLGIAWVVFKSLQWAASVPEAEKKVEVLKPEEEKPISFPEWTKSIVVLPFENISPEDGQDYFCDGVTDEIITDLSSIHDLRVISRSSAMMLKGSKKAVRDIAKELDVQYVLEGTVRKAGSDIRITAQLIDAIKDAHLWADKYNGKLDDVFDLQEKVSRSIVDTLKLKLNPEEKKRISERPIGDIQAYECYLSARLEFFRATEDGLKRALQNLKTGLEIIGENTLLNKGMAEVYLHYREYGVKTDEETLLNAEKFANKVIESQPESVESYYLKGKIERLRGSASKAIKYFKKAYNINPNNTEVLLFLGNAYGLHAGRTSIAKELLKRLFEIDPLTPMNYAVLGLSQMVEGQLDNTLSTIQKFSEVAGDDVWQYLIKAYIYAWQKRREEVFELVDKMVKQESMGRIHDNLAEWCLFFKYALLGEKKKALETITEDVKSFFWNDPEFMWLGVCNYALIDEKEEALKWVEHIIDRGWINYPFLNEKAPFFENIRGEPRFKKLMERVKHEWENFEV